MTKEQQLWIQTHRIIGEFIGTLEGICAWEIPIELKEKLTDKVQELRKTKIISLETKTKGTDGTE
jgi:hypothetical protein